MYTANEDDVKNTVNDFLAFCSFIDERAPVLSKKSVVLGKKDLFALNQNLINKKDVSAPNYIQESYTVIDLMFKLALYGGLYKRSSDEKGNVYLVRTERKNEFDELTLYEKYLFLLEVFYTDFDLSDLILFGSAYYVISYTILKIAAAKPGEKLFKDKFSFDTICESIFSYSDIVVYYLSFFGLFDYVPIVDKEKKLIKYDYKIEAIIPSKFGVAVCGILKEQDIGDWNLSWLEDGRGSDEEFIPGIRYQSMFHGLTKPVKEKDKAKELIYKESKKAGYIPLFKYFQSVFPEGALNRTVTASVVSDPKGTYIFKVSLKAGIWRTIAMSHQHTLEDLHIAIQAAFDFDNDHLYAFFLDGTRHSKTVFHSPYCNEFPSADDYPLESIGLYSGQNILYLFDFGDDWRFYVCLIKIDKEMELPKIPYIIDSKGKAPKQYWFDDETDSDEENF